MTAEEFNAVLGFSQSSTITLKHPVGYFCPFTDNGKKVASCVIKTYPKVIRYKFDEVSLFGTKTGHATAFRGFHQRTTIVYE